MSRSPFFCGCSATAPCLAASRRWQKSWWLEKHLEKNAVVIEFPSVTAALARDVNTVPFATVRVQVRIGSRVATALKGIKETNGVMRKIGRAALRGVAR